MFSVVARETGHPVFNLKNIQQMLDIPYRLASREKCTPAELQEALKFREESHGFCPFLPKSSIDKLAPGTYYLEFISANYERNYKRMHRVD